jgi:hypothetical protein
VSQPSSCSSPHLPSTFSGQKTPSVENTSPTISHQAFKRSKGLTEGVAPMCAGYHDPSIYGALFSISTHGSGHAGRRWKRSRSSRQSLSHNRHRRRPKQHPRSVSRLVVAMAKAATSHCLTVGRGDGQSSTLACARVSPNQSLSSVLSLLCPLSSSLATGQNVIDHSTRSATPGRSRGRKPSANREARR